MRELPLSLIYERAEALAKLLARRTDSRAQTQYCQVLGCNLDQIAEVFARDGIDLFAETTVITGTARYRRYLRGSGEWNISTDLKIDRLGPRGWKFVGRITDRHAGIYDFLSKKWRGLASFNYDPENCEITIRIDEAVIQCFLHADDCFIFSLYGVCPAPADIPSFAWWIYCPYVAAKKIMKFYDGQLPPLTEISTGYISTRIDRLGMWFIDFLIKNYGEEAICKILSNYIYHDRIDYWVRIKERFPQVTLTVAMKPTVKNFVTASKITNIKFMLHMNYQRTVKASCVFDWCFFCLRFQDRVLNGVLSAVNRRFLKPKTTILRRLASVQTARYSHIPAAIELMTLEAFKFIF